MDPTHARSESETIWVLSDSEVEESDMEDGEEITSMSLNRGESDEDGDDTEGETPGHGLLNPGFSKSVIRDVTYHGLPPDTERDRYGSLIHFIVSSARQIGGQGSGTSVNRCFLVGRLGPVTRGALAGLEPSAWVQRTNVTQLAKMGFCS